LNIAITIIILDITHRPALYLKRNISETVFCLRLQILPTQLVSLDSLRNIVFEMKDRTMDNVQNYDSCINIPSSQTYR
jgi:hypothetical protein